MLVLHLFYTGFTPALHLSYISTCKNQHVSLFSHMSENASHFFSELKQLFVFKTPNHFVKNLFSERYMSFQTILNFTIYGIQFIGL